MVLAIYPFNQGLFTFTIYRVYVISTGCLTHLFHQIRDSVVRFWLASVCGGERRTARSGIPVSGRALPECLWCGQQTETGILARNLTQAEAAQHHTITSHSREHRTRAECDHAHTNHGRDDSSSTTNCQIIDAGKWDPRPRRIKNRFGRRK